MWNNISFPTNTETFKGIMVFDYIFHIHMNILGALIELTPNTEMSGNCGGNKNKTIAYCGPLITKYMNFARGASSGGGWRGKLKMYAWYE